MSFYFYFYYDRRIGSEDSDRTVGGFNMESRIKACSFGVKLTWATNEAAFWFCLLSVSSFLRFFSFFIIHLFILLFTLYLLLYNNSRSSPRISPFVQKYFTYFWLVVLKYNSDWNFIIHLHFVFIIVFVFFAFAFCFLLRLLFFCSLWSGQGKARQGVFFDN